MLSARTLLALLSCGAIIISTLDFGHAHKGATGIVKERMDDMKALKHAMKALDPTFKGRVDFDVSKIAAVGGEMSQIARRMAARFPAGSNQSPSEARGAIWSEWSKFEALISEFDSAAVTLSRAETKAAFDKAYVAVGASCITCHKPYRERK